MGFVAAVFPRRCRSHAYTAHNRPLFEAATVLLTTDVCIAMMLATQLVSITPQTMNHDSSASTLDVNSTRNLLQVIGLKSKIRASNFLQPVCNN